MSLGFRSGSTKGLMDTILGEIACRVAVRPKSVVTWWILHNEGSCWINTILWDEHTKMWEIQWNSELGAYETTPWEVYQLYRCSTLPNQSIGLEFLNSNSRRLILRPKFGPHRTLFLQMIECICIKDASLSCMVSMNSELQVSVLINDDQMMIHTIVIPHIPNPHTERSISSKRFRDIVHRAIRWGEMHFDEICNVYI